MLNDGISTPDGSPVPTLPAPGKVVDVVDVVVDVDVEDVEEVVEVDVEEVVDDEVVVLDVVVVVGRDGGGGRGGNSMSPRSGNSSWEQSTGSAVSPSMKAQ